ncbi:IS110 family transposase [Pseudarthrobacter sp. P1]|uniref:IS110 family transposase n=1 Tax=Pseudarthrobacter sp. P1 TaxID=3418418 RepID=UPI003CF48AF6
MDVHAVSVAGCALAPDTGELVQAQIHSDPAVVLEWIRRFAPPVKAVYESGPTGYVLARFLREAGIDCVVAASSKLLRAPGDKVKTDKRDARLLAEMLAVGSVTEVRVPTREQEDLRDLSRLRATAAKDLAHARQHVNAILLRHGIRYRRRRSGRRSTCCGCTGSALTHRCCSSPTRPTLNRPNCSQRI